MPHGCRIRYGRKASVAIILTVGMLYMAPVAMADAIIITKAMTASTIAEIFIDPASIRVEVEIGASDLMGFRNLMPDNVYERMGFEPEPFRKRLARFFGEDFVFRPDGGTPLSGRVLVLEPRKRVVRDEITGEPKPVKDEEGEDVVYAVLEYPLNQRPQTLVMHPPMTETGKPAASIGMLTYHENLPVNDFRYFVTEETLDLDWEDPWYSTFRNRNLRRQYDSPVNAFLYVEPYEVRVEIIVRPVDMENWLDLGLADRRTIPVDMQYELQRKIAEFLAEHLDLVIDGRPVEPELDRVNFLRRTLRTSTVISPPEELVAVSATLGVIFAAPTEGLPQEASITWDLFSDRIRSVPAAATDEAGPLRFFLAPDDNVLRWTNFLKNPTLPTLVEIVPPPGPGVRIARWAGWFFAAALVAGLAIQAGRAMRNRTVSKRGLAAILVLILLTVACFAVALPNRLSPKRTSEIVAALLGNIYRAFDFRGEEHIYDTLDRSVAGDLLTEIYLETRRGLELASQGGARTKVKRVEMLDVESRGLKDGSGFVARARWNVIGSVGHWGHVHDRTNRYEAELTIRPVEGTWKVTKLDILQEERL